MQTSIVVFFLVCLLCWKRIGYSVYTGKISISTAKQFEYNFTMFGLYIFMKYPWIYCIRTINVILRTFRHLSPIFTYHLWMLMRLMGDVCKLSSVIEQHRKQRQRKKEWNFSHRLFLRLLCFYIYTFWVALFSALSTKRTEMEHNFVGLLISTDIGMKECVRVE